MKNIFLLISIGLLPFTATFGQGDPVGDCVTAIQGCKAELIAFAKDFLPQVPADCKYWNGDCSITGEIWRNGSVSFGTNKSFSTYKNEPFKLTVYGGIIGEELQICKTAWCDYVFDDSFRLAPLRDVSSYVNSQKHLPGCTPGGVIEKQAGFYLDEQTPQQQQKLEEVFLYLMDLDDRITVLKNKYGGASENFPEPLKTEDSPIVQSLSDQDPETSTATVDCYEISAASSSSAKDGLVGLRITGATGPFNISWPEQGGGSILHVNCEDNLIRIPNLKSGSYTFTVKEAVSLTVLGSCTVTINVSASSLCDEIGSRGRCTNELLSILTGEFNKDRPSCIQWGGEACSNNGPIFRTGNVCIGTSVGKSGFSLAVSGGIMTDKFRVELCSGNWCDYVFDPEYQLMPLAEVKKYVQTQNSLPGMVTQNEITKEGGYELKSVKLDQQVKIEEAYLHLIQLDKEIKKLHQSLQDKQ